MKDSTINILMKIFVLITFNNAAPDGDAGDVPIYTHGLSMHGVLVGCDRSGHSNRADAAKCEEKIVINIRIASTDNINPSDQKYLWLDELFDAGTKTRAKLLHPYLIELAVVGPMLMYPLEYEHVLDGRCDGKTLMPVKEALIGDCGTQNDKYGKEVNKQEHHTEQRRNHHAVHKRYNANDSLPLFTTFDHRLGAISNVQHRPQHQRPGYDLLQCYHCMTLSQSSAHNENCSCCATKIDSENWKMFDGDHQRHNGRVNRTEIFNEDFTSDHGNGYGCSSDATGCLNGNAIKPSIRQLREHNQLATNPKKESNYPHSPNGENGKMLPNYVNQAKFGGKLLQRNPNNDGKKSANNIANPGPTDNIDFENPENQQIEFHNNRDDDSHATMSYSDVSGSPFDDNILELAAQNDNHKSASPNDKGNNEEMIGKPESASEFTRKTEAQMGSEDGNADDNGSGNENRFDEEGGDEDAGDDDSGGAMDADDEEDAGWWREFNGYLNMPTAASVNSEVMNWREANNVASIPNYIQVLNDHPLLYPKVFRQHRTPSDYSREDRLITDKNLTIDDKLAFLDMLHQPEKKSTDDTDHRLNNGALEISLFDTGYPDDNNEMDRSRRSYTNADSMSNNDDDDDVDDGDNSIDDRDKLIESNHQQRSACYRVYHMNAPMPFRGYDLRIFVQHDDGEWLSLAGVVSVSNLQPNASNHPVAISLTTSNQQQPPQIKFPSTDTNNDTSDLFNLKNHKLLVSTDTNPLSDDLMVLDPEKVSNDKELRDEIGTALCDTSSTSAARWSRTNDDDGDGTDVVADDNDNSKNGKLNHNSVEYLHRAANKDRRRGRSAIVKRLSGVENLRFGEEVIGKCRHDERQECLNLLHKRTVDDGKITIQFPFVGNRLVREQQRQVEIGSIITDGTTMETLNVAVVVTNLGNKMDNFRVVLHKCHGPVHINATKKMKLAVNRATLVEFQLVLPMFYEHKERDCAVSVEDEGGEEVAERRFLISSTERCFCVGSCECFCGSAFLPSGGVHACHEMSVLASTHAGLVGHEGGRAPFVVEPGSLVLVCLLFLLLVLCLGLVKASIGCCHPVVDEWKFAYLQPHIKYAEASRCRKFSINTIFFFVFPCVACCKCFMPSDDDIDDDNHNVRWFRGLRQQERTVPKDEDTECSDMDDEKSQLLSDADSGPISYGRMTAASESVTPSAFRDFSIADGPDDADCDDDLDFVVAALNDSRQSLRVLDGHCSEVSDLANAAFVEAKRLVKRLMLSKLVYRILHNPIGEVDVAENTSYSIRGYFLPDIGTGYQFITTMPLRQYWKLNVEKHSLVPVVPPVLLLAKDFTRTYANKLEVLEAADLTTTPCVNAPCINVLHQDARFYLSK